ncbi:Glutathione-dependent reductase [Oopsacas minuta]|uniref:Glutathione-dependent reductase n=1 Tax=Oopsacas minuta TaxID=111878 RepID=A0AAV7KM99_9METZ|nr:Glutathione-dependent reductase [Oopsacas minuta]
MATLSNTIIEKGEFIRPPSEFREMVPSKSFPAEDKRYHLYVSYACPWAHRTLIMRMLKGLDDVITVNVVHWLLGEGGWSFTPVEDGSTEESVHGFSFIKQIYLHTNEKYTGRHSVPILYDKKQKTIVNNESSEIIRILNSGFNNLAKHPDRDFYPEPLRGKIDEINDIIYNGVNNGVYKCGFATTQQAYDKAVIELFSTLDKLEDILSKQRYLCGDKFTEADIRLFVTLIRFDPVYVQHFKCNIKRIQDYPNLSGFLREVYSIPEVKETINLKHIKHHYMKSHNKLNTYSIVTMGPELDWDSPHGRDNLPAQPI